MRAAGSIRNRYALVLLMLIGSGGATLRAGEPPAADSSRVADGSPQATAAKGVPVTIRLLDDTLLSARLSTIAGNHLHVHDAPPIPLASVWSLETTHPASAPAAPVSTIALRDGSHLRAELLSWTPKDAEIRFRGASISVPSAQLQAWLHPSVTDAGRGADPEGETSTRDGGAGGEDRIHAELDGRSLRLGGLLQAYGDGAWTLLHGGAERTLRGERIRRIAFAQTARIDPVRPQAALSLTDGSRLHGTVEGMEAERLTFHSEALGRVVVPWDEVRGIHWFSDHVLFLDAIDPIDVKEESLAAPALPFRRNASVYGTPMRMRGETFDRGLGVHAHAALTFEIDPTWTAFVAVIGLDASGGAVGDCVFRVERDGETVFRMRVTGTTPPTPIRVPVEGATRLRLVVEYGERFDIGDNANWARARLIREPSPVDATPDDAAD